MAARKQIDFPLGEWASDPALGRCSPATVGIFSRIAVDMLRRNDPAGVMADSMDGLARLCHCGPLELTGALNELAATKAADVTTCNAHVTIAWSWLRDLAGRREENRLKVQASRDAKKALTGGGNAVVTRPRDAMFDAIAKIECPSGKITEAEGARIGRAKKEIEAVGGKAEEVPAAAARWNKAHKDIPCNANILRTHWGALAPTMVLQGGWGSWFTMDFSAQEKIRTWARKTWPEEAKTRSGPLYDQWAVGKWEDWRQEQARRQGGSGT